MTIMQKFKLPHTTLRAGFLAESGRIVSNEFDQLNFARRSLYGFVHDILGTADSAPYMFNENIALLPERQDNSLFISYRTNIIKGIDVDLNFSHDIIAGANLIPPPGIPRSKRDTIDLPLDYSYDCRIAIDSNALRFIRYGALYARQSHVRLLPEPETVLSDLNARSGTFLSSWNTEVGFEFLSQPIWHSISLKAGGRFYYIDNAHFFYQGYGRFPDNRIESEDRVLEFSAGMVWGIP